MRLIERLSASRRRDDGGFTLIELLVVVVILGILAGVVVFSVNGVQDKGQTAARRTDERTLRTAQAAFNAKFGRYAASDDELAAKGFLSSPSTQHDTAPAGKSFLIGYGQPNDGVSPGGWPVLSLAAGRDNGRPTPFLSQRGPGNLNTNYLFDPLVWRDATGDPVPWLATGWERSADGLQWTFTLRPNVKWQDFPATGEVLTADDVVFTFDYLKNATGVTAAQVNSVKNRNTFIRDFVTNVTAVPGTPERVVFTLNQPVNTFMTRLAQSLLILPRHIWSTVSNPMTNPPTNLDVYKGTGPYILQNPGSYTPSTGVSEYVANPNFFLGEPYVKRLRFITVSDEIGQLLNGDVSAGGVGNEESVTQEALDTVAAAGFQKIENPGGWNRALHFNGLRGFPYDNAAFRRAVAYTVDRAALLQNIVGGRGELSNLGGLAPSHPFLAPGLPAYARNVDTAKGLLDSLGIVDGSDGDAIRELPATFGGSPVTGGGSNFNVTLYTSDRFSSDTVEAVQQYLLDVGLASTYVVEDSNAADCRAGQANYDMAFVGYGNLTADPDQLRTRYKDTGSPLAPGVCANPPFTSVWGWATATSTTSTVNGSRTGMNFSALAARQLVEPDPTARRSQLHDMQEIIATEVPLISLYSPFSTIFYPPGGFSAWYSTPGGTPPGPPGFNNKHVFITGKQFGLPAV